MVGGTSAEDGAACALLRCTTELSGAGDAIRLPEAAAGLCGVTTGSATGCNLDACATSACDEDDWPTGVVAAVGLLWGC